MALREKNNQEPIQRPKLDERFIMNLKGKDFVLYAGLLDLAHQKGLHSLVVEAIQYPVKDNGFEAICKATVESIEGQQFIELGDANPKNCNQMIANHILRMAATRAKARALRDFTNIGMTCIEELADPDDVPGDEKPRNGNGAKSLQQTSAPVNGNGNSNGNGKSNPAESNGSGNSKKTAPRTSQEQSSNGKQESGPKPSTAQIKAIENLARRRNITAEELDTMVQQHYGTAIENINSSQASNFIRILQQSA